METNILGIRISIFLGCIFWRDSEFCPQEGFGEECGLLVYYKTILLIKTIGIIIKL